MKKFLILVLCLMTIRPCFAEERTQNIMNFCVLSSCINIIGGCGYSSIFNPGYQGSTPASYYSYTDAQGMALGLSWTGLGSSVVYVTSYNSPTMRMAHVKTYHTGYVEVNFVQIVYGSVGGSVGVQSTSKTTINKDLYWYFYGG